LEQLPEHVVRGLSVAFVILICMVFAFFTWCCLALAQNEDDNNDRMGIVFDEYEKEDWDGV